MNWEFQIIHMYKEMGCLFSQDFKFGMDLPPSEVWIPSTGDQLALVTLSLLEATSTISRELTLWNFFLVLSWNLYPAVSTYWSQFYLLGIYKTFLLFSLWNLLKGMKTETWSHYSLLLCRLTIIPLTNKGKSANVGIHSFIFRPKLRPKPIFQLSQSKPFL